MLDLLGDVLKRATERGATAADAFLVEDRAFSAQVRLGRVDTVKHAREQHLSLRVFSGKSALLTGLIETYSPLEPVSRVILAHQHEPPAVLMPELARTAYRAVYAGGENRAGLIRTLFFEVSGLRPETEDAVTDTITRVVGLLVAYLMTQMAEGRLRRMHPLLALQSFIGPILFHILTRPIAERVLRLDIEGEAAVTLLAETWLRAMATEEDGDA